MNLLVLTLRDGAGTWAGTLDLLNHPWRSSTSQQNGLAHCELIAISIGYVNSENWRQAVVPELPEYCHKERPKASERYEFYNVLCIEWENCIAYRKGVGRVEKYIWEAQPLEWINITLG